MQQDIIIDINNPYVQGLMKIINKFMLEEASGIIEPECRMAKNISDLRRIFWNDKKKMVIGGNPPMFSAPTPDLYRIIFKHP